MGVADVSENGFALGWDEIKLPQPAVRRATRCTRRARCWRCASRKSRPQWGIVKVRTRGIKQDGKVVIEYARSVMVWGSAHAPQRDLFPEAHG